MKQVRTNKYSILVFLKQYTLGSAGCTQNDITALLSISGENLWSNEKLKIESIQQNLFILAFLVFYIKSIARPIMEFKHQR